MKRLIYFALICFLFSCSQSKNNGDATDDSDSIQLEDYKPIRNKPEWQKFKTCLNNQQGYIYTDIKTENDECFIVWISYEWEDPETAPKDLQNVAEFKSCYSFDKDFLKIGTIARYKYSENGDVLDKIEYDFPDWSYVIPDTEGEIIAQETIGILKKHYPYNRDANKLYAKRSGDL